MWAWASKHAPSPERPLILAPEQPKTVRHHPECGPAGWNPGAESAPKLTETLSPLLSPLLLLFGTIQYQSAEVSERP